MKKQKEILINMRARKLEEVRIEAKKLVQMQIEKEMEERREKRRKWLEENNGGI